ncbi:MAG: hypothetical protein HYX61_03400 [Gammaproteobacteria bacterium]|jgi:hypothetical protein|nr:hypothetical protein [Gammaproteobacteria bacterium]
MIYIKGRTGLVLPKQTGNISKKREISSNAIEQWRKHLSMTDIASSAKALYVTLQDCHQVSLPYQERFDILSTLRPTLSYIFQALQKFYDTQEVLNENQRAIADLVNALNFEMINGYKLVIEDVCAQFFCNQNILIGSLQNALAYCSKIIFYSYEQHRPTPEGIWLELHHLFEFARKRGLEHKSLKNFLAWQARYKTLADMYKQCLLFSIANPNHLRRAQITQLFYALEVWAPLLSLKETDKSGSCLYIVDINQDSPPRYVGLYHEAPTYCYYLNLESVNDHLVKLLSMHGASNDDKLAKYFNAAELALPYAHIESILNSWRSLRARSFERKRAQGQIKVCLGISACHWYLSQEKGLPIVASEETFPDLEQIDINVLPESSSHEDVGTQKFPVTACEIIDQSPKGFCLKWTQEIPSHLQSGEIIGLEGETETLTKVWSIGVIRWLKNESSHVTLLGIELLSMQALPVKARLSETTVQYSIPTIVLPEQPEAHKPMRLITPPLPFKVGNEVEIEFESKIYTATLQKSFGATSSYQEFGLLFAYQQLTFPSTLDVIKTDPSSAKSIS